MYNFTKDLETGNVTVDSQHRQWIANLNKVLEDCARGQGRDNMRENIMFLKEYTVRHFNDEERFQQQNNYPDFIEHKKYHDAFKKTMDSIVADFEKNGPSILLTGRINRELGDWFVNHIKCQDLKMVSYIKSKTGK